MLANVFMALMSFVFPPLDTPGGPIAMAATVTPIVAAVPGAPTQANLPPFA
ncbi:MAG TPA: hypothetical protein VHX17_12935 [Candidatus Cybelea sp.]|jgi:hypothetical protein|nr:hypothetical protein [Candidatus Cybelea sp.]